MKLERRRWEDAVLDIVFFGLMTAMFSGTYAGMVVACIASAVCSMYLLIYPPKFIKEMFHCDLYSEQSF